MRTSATNSLVTAAAAVLLIGAGALALISQQVGKQRTAGKLTIVYSNNRIGEIEPCG